MTYLLNFPRGLHIFEKWSTIITCKCQNPTLFHHMPLPSASINNIILPEPIVRHLHPECQQIFDLFHLTTYQRIEWKRRILILEPRPIVRFCKDPKGRLLSIVWEITKAHKINLAVSIYHSQVPKIYASPTSNLGPIQIKIRINEAENARNSSGFILRPPSHSLYTIVAKG